eukprot:TRINITY_DN3028_c0_g1_i2.p1 TRINITY_DN3028_c0_g1~~TRINITY_DN3028_c0_g1_i2.p1  ORF type:complete len:368 (-),score=95.20 TRINITY_DN3028_c0_g1_i2:46-1149(-)
MIKLMFTTLASKLNVRLTALDSALQTLQSDLRAVGSKLDTTVASVESLEQRIVQIVSKSATGIPNEDMAEFLKQQREELGDLAHSVKQLASIRDSLRQDVAAVSVDHGNAPYNVFITQEPIKNLAKALMQQGATGEGLHKNNIYAVLHKMANMEARIVDAWDQAFADASDALRLYKEAQPETKGTAKTTVKKPREGSARKRGRPAAAAAAVTPAATSAAVAAATAAATAVVVAEEPPAKSAKQQDVPAPAVVEDPVQEHPRSPSPTVDVAPSRTLPQVTHYTVQQLQQLQSCSQEQFSALSLVQRQEIEAAMRKHNLAVPHFMAAAPHAPANTPAPTAVSPTPIIVSAVPSTPTVPKVSFAADDMDL